MSPRHSANNQFIQRDVFPVGRIERSDIRQNGGKRAADFAMLNPPYVEYLVLTALLVPPENRWDESGSVPLISRPVSERRRDPDDEAGGIHGDDMHMGIAGS